MSNTTGWRAPAALPRPARDEERVERARLRALIKAGYPPAVAYGIAGSNADVGLAVGLVEAGCPVRLAAQLVC